MDNFNQQNQDQNQNQQPYQDQQNYQQQQPYQQQPYQQQPYQNNGPTNVMAIVGIICGIIGIIACWFPYVNIVALVIAVLGIIFSVKGMGVAKTTGTGNGMAVAGLVCAIIGTVFAGIGTICTVACGAALCSAQNEINSWGKYFY